MKVGWGCCVKGVGGGEREEGIQKELLMLKVI